MNKVKIGLIGCGKQAPKHISGLRKVPGVELVLADINPEFARDLADREGLKWVPGVEEIFNAPDIQAVDICTPTGSHAGLIRRAVDSDKDFFCEKPLCEGVEEALDIEELTRRKGKAGMVGYIYRFAPALELGRGLMEDVPGTGESTALGCIAAAYFRLGGRGGHQLWKHRKESGGGAINEMLVHMVDLAIWYFGPVSGVDVLACDLIRPSRLINGRIEEADAEDFVLVRLKTASGVPVLCQADLVTPSFMQFAEVQGTNGTFMASIQPEMPSYLYCEKSVAGYRAGKTVFNFGAPNLFEAQLSEFVRAVRSKTQPSRCTINDSVLLLKTLEKIRKEIGN